MEFNTNRAKVKDDVTLKVTADPNSFVALVAIDSGSLLLADPNDVTEQKVYCA